MHSVLEHADGHAAGLCGDGLAGVQPAVLEEHQRADLHARLLAKLDRALEVPRDEEDRHVAGPHVPGALPRHLAGRPDHRDGGRRRDSTILERLPQEAGERAVRLAHHALLLRPPLTNY